MTDSSQEFDETEVGRRTLLGLVAAGAVGLVASPVLANTLNPPPAHNGRADPSGRFDRKVVAITGATSGIGQATAEAFAREGARVVFCGRREERGSAVEAGIRAFGGQADYVRCDVRDPAQVQAFIDGAVERHGRLDIAFNNAGIANPPAEIQGLPIETCLDVMLTNAGGIWFAMKAELSHMRRQGGGIILNMASVSGHEGFPPLAHYGASKHAVIGMTKAIAKQHAPLNIRVNSISPLAVDTPQLRESARVQNTTLERMALSFPTPRIGRPEEIARAVMFLASEDASLVTGMDLDITAGFLA